MARTAPVPNIPPIPGMCPSIAILAGGGGGGGGSGNGSGNGQGNGPGDGSGNGDAAAGDGSGAGSCGQGSGGGCPNPEHGQASGTQAGDPIEALSGRVFTLPSNDLALGGPLPLVIKRFYSSTSAKEDVGLGYGWSHTLAWRVQLKRKQVTLVRQDGTREIVAELPIGEAAMLAAGRLTRLQSSFVLLDADRRTRTFAEVVPGSDHFVLTEVADGYGNRIRLGYDERGALVRVVDAVGREVRVARHTSGHIAAFEVKNAASQGQWVRFFTYLYDDAGDLVSATNARDIPTKYAYDEHYLVAETSGSGRTAHFRYDERRRCVETWVDYPGTVDQSIDASAPKLLADGVTVAKGVLHCFVERSEDYVEVVTSRTVRRYFANELGRPDKSVIAGGVSTNNYDAWGNLTDHTDAENATWRYDRDPFGRIIRETDPVGASHVTRYDTRGYVQERVDPLGHVYRYMRNVQGDVLALHDDVGPVIEHAYDARGQRITIGLPDGSLTRMFYDDMGNRVRVVEPNGGAREIRYDFFGRIVGFVDEVGRETRYVYDANSRVVSCRRADGATTQFTYDRDDNLASVTVATGHRYELDWSGFRVVHEVRRADGTKVGFKYDREGDLVRVTNEAGEAHTIERDGMGRVVAETTFDGRTLKYRVDKVGRIARIVQPDRRFVSFEYDPAGRLAKRSFNDEIVEVFSYDPLGRLTSAADGRNTTTFAYDARGQLVSERQAFAGTTHWIESVFDAAGRRVEKRTSTGYVEKCRYDSMGLPHELTLDGSAGPFAFGWDKTGAEIERRLPPGVTLKNDIGTNGLIHRRQLLSSSAVDTLWEQRFTYDASGVMTSVADDKKGSVELEHDAVGQLLKRVPQHALKELFSYDAVGNRHDGRSRRYGAGGVLEARDQTTYERDANHQLTKRVDRLADGKQVVTRYAWDARGRLSKIELPNGLVAHYTYDCFARRIEKRIERRGRVVTSQRFVWDHDAVVHELRANGDSFDERTFAYMPDGYEPIAQRDAQGARKTWSYFVNDSSLRPEIVIDDTGRIVHAIQGRAFGAFDDEAARETTPHRFAGQWEDEESGLFYNHYRYYDPENGVYISPEPLGLQGGPRPFAYASNAPDHRIDPDGRAGMRSTATGGGTTGRGTAAGQYGPRGEDVEPDLHPAVRGCLLARDESLHGSRAGSQRHPASCAEPRAVSDYLRQRGVPDDASDDEIRSALQDMRIGANQADESGRARAPCRNCSQFLANLMERYGAPHPDNIAPGYRGARGNGEQTNFTPPPEGSRGYHQSYAAARRAYERRTGRAPAPPAA